MAEQVDQVQEVLVVVAELELLEVMEQLIVAQRVILEVLE